MTRPLHTLAQGRRTRDEFDLCAGQAPPRDRLADERAPHSWHALLARWDVRAGSASERALARAVLLDAERHSPSVVRVAAALLRRRRPTPAATPFTTTTRRDRRPNHCGEHQP